MGLFLVSAVKGILALGFRIFASSRCHSELLLSNATVVLSIFPIAFRRTSQTAPDASEGFVVGPNRESAFLQQTIG